MIEWVLDTHYATRFNQQPSAEDAILVWDGIESVLTPLMRRIEIDFPGVKVFSLPTLGSKDVRRHIELGVRGTPEQVPLAMTEIRREVIALDYCFDPRTAA
jgi:molybdopterin-biosynthesis enzyme MoeA-like protein